MQEFTKDGLRITTNKKYLNINIVHMFLQKSYWAKGIDFKTLKNAIKNSLCYGMYKDGRQIGFARVITDYTTHAYLCDFFIVDSQQGKGYGKWLMESILKHPDLKNLKHWLLMTTDAHRLYNKFGFKKLKNQEHYMEKLQA